MKDLTETNLDSGPRCGEPFGIYDPDTSSWKTLIEYGLTGLAWSSGTFPKSGMMRSGIAFRLEHSVRLIGEPEFGWLATPTAAQNQSYPSMMKHPSCRNFVKVFGGGPIHPEAYEWLMGFPLGMTDVESSETQ